MNETRPNQVRALSGLVDLVARIRNAIGPLVEPPARTVLVIQPPAKSDVVPPTAGGFYIGKNVATGTAVVASASELDRHLLIIGATGCGKTTLIERLFIEEVTKWQ